MSQHPPSRLTDAMMKRSSIARDNSIFTGIPTIASLKPVTYLYSASLFPCFATLSSENLFGFNICTYGFSSSAAFDCRSVTEIVSGGLIFSISDRGFKIGKVQKRSPKKVSLAVITAIQRLACLLWPSVECGLKGNGIPCPKPVLRAIGVPIKTQNPVPALGHCTFRSNWKSPCPSMSFSHTSSELSMYDPPSV